MLESVFESCDEALILGEIVGLVTEVLAKMGDFVARLILDDNAEAGGTGVTTGAAIAVGDQVVLGRTLVGGTLPLGKKRIVGAAA
jgi:hypothetical protein